MSTDLEFCPDLPKLRLSPIKVHARQRSLDQDSHGRAGVTVKQEESNFAGSGDGEECRTPTSAEHKIPAIVNCPPAPRKPNTRVAPCKRKLSELQFVEIVRREEVESFLRSSFKAVSKRRCPCA